MSDLPTHNHMTRDIKPPGVCPGCDARFPDDDFMHCPTCGVLVLDMDTLSSEPSRVEGSEQRRRLKPCGHELAVTVGSGTLSYETAFKAEDPSWLSRED